MNLSMKVLGMTEVEIYDVGIEILKEKLGPAIDRFLPQCKPGEGNWSVDRHKWINSEQDVETLARRIQQSREKEREEARLRQHRATASHAEILEMTDLEIYKTGIEVLGEKLGPAGMNRFHRYCAQLNVEKDATGRTETAAGYEPQPPLQETHPPQ